MSEKARDEALQKLSDHRAELSHLEMQNAQLVGHFTKQGEEMDQLRGQPKMQCDVFKEVQDHVFTIAGRLRMALSGSINF